MITGDTPAAADADAYANARKQALAQHADLVRARIPFNLIEEALK